jgi:hypothetical protein
MYSKGIWNGIQKEGIYALGGIDNSNPLRSW